MMTNAEVKGLLVEDNPVDVRQIRELLQEIRHTNSNLPLFEFLYADHLDAGLRLLARRPIHIVLLDLWLPDSEGLDTFQQIHQAAPGIPIVILSGLQEKHLALTAVRNGAQDYLLKEDLNRNSILRTIWYALEKQRLQDQLADFEQKYRRIAAKLRVIAKSVGRLSAHYETDQLVEAGRGAIQEIIENYRISLYLVQGDELILSIYLDPEGKPNRKQAHRLKFGEGVAGRVAESIQPWISPGFERSPSSRSNGKNGNRAPYEVCVPILAGQSLLGVIDLQTDSTPVLEVSDMQALEVLAHHLAVTLVNARLYNETRVRLDQIHTLQRINLELATNRELQPTLNFILEQTLKQLQVDAAAILKFSKKMKILEYAAGMGFKTPALKYTRLALGEGLAGKAALEQEILHVPDLIHSPHGFIRSPHMREEAFGIYYAVPLAVGGELKGILEIFGRSPINGNEEWFQYLKTLANQAAIAIENASLYSGLQESNQELLLTYDTTLAGWSRVLELRDGETEGHCQRVTEMAVRLAKAMEIPQENLRDVRYGALLHDIGKMGVPDAILHKNGPLDEEEMELMRMHPAWAYELLKGIDFLKNALDIPYYHHEKWNGEGYPCGLQGDSIPLPARIFAIIDVWDALTSVRPYRAAWPVERARAYIREEAGEHFDPQVVEAFFQTFFQPEGPL